MPNDNDKIPASIKRLGERIRLPLDSIQGTGPNGQVTLQDFKTHRAAQARAGAPTAVAAPAGRQVPARPVGTTSGPRALNPLLAKMQASGQTGGRGPAPALFNSGDLPPYTASGNETTELLRLPTDLRHAAAKADQAEWARLFNAYADLPDDEVEVGAALIYEPAVNDPGNRDYQDRFTAWRSGR